MESFWFFLFLVSLLLLCVLVVLSVVLVYSVLLGFDAACIVYLIVVELEVLSLLAFGCFLVSFR